MYSCSAVVAWQAVAAADLRSARAGRARPRFSTSPRWPYRPHGVAVLSRDAAPGPVRGPVRFSRVHSCGACLRARCRSYVGRGGNWAALRQVSQCSLDVPWPYQSRRACRPPRICSTAHRRPQKCLARATACSQECRVAWLCASPALQASALYRTTQAFSSSMWHHPTRRTLPLAAADGAHNAATMSSGRPRSRWLLVCTATFALSRRRRRPSPPPQ